MHSRQTFSVALTSFTMLVATVATADDKSVKDELKRQEGSWSVTSSIYDGQAASEDLIRSIKRVVEGDHAVWERDGKRFAGTTIEVDPACEPKTIDVIPDGGRNRGERVLGIYKFEGEKLTICMAEPGKPRPKSFQADKGSGCTLRTFTRDRRTTPPRK
jgi:uncharacterized protein (TIGR03067 family)